MEFQQPTMGGTTTPQGFDADIRKKDVEENKDLAAFSYVWIMSVFVYLSKRQSPFVAFHAKQGIVLFVLSIAFYFVPGVGRFLELLVLGGAILGFLAGAQGQWKELPLIGALSRGVVPQLSERGKFSESALHLLRVLADRVRVFFKHVPHQEGSKGIFDPAVPKVTPRAPTIPPASAASGGTSSIMGALQQKPPSPAPIPSAPPSAPLSS